MALTNQLGLDLAKKQARTPVPTAPAPKAPIPGASNPGTTINKQTGQVFQNWQNIVLQNKMNKQLI